MLARPVGWSDRPSGQHQYGSIQFGSTERERERVYEGERWRRGLRA
jgi:hypothetical protein